MNDIVLITGGTGYLGGRIRDCLAERTPFLLRLTAPEGNINTVDNKEIIPMDLLDKKQVEAACRDVRYIIHLAAMNEIDSTQDPAGALLVTSLGTLNLLQAAQRNGVQRFIYFSTAHIYGAPLQGFINEKTLPRPVHPYAITHRTAEDFVLSNRDMESVVIRLSNALGSPVQPDITRWSLVANDLCRQATSGGKMELKSSGVQWRDFISITDVCNAVIHLLDLPIDFLNDGIFNLGGENPMQIFQLAELIAYRCELILGYRPPLIRPPVIPGEETKKIFYSIERLKSTGFCLSGKIEKEIDDTLLFCKKHFGVV